MPTADLALDDAAAAADAAGVTMRELDEPADHQAAERLIDRVWSANGRSPLLASEVMRMLAFSGSYVAGAYDEGELVGVAVGVLADHRPGVGVTALHSHMAGVAPEAQGGAVGFALKLHQRAWALARGIGVVTWTFDPLVGRNAYFNLTKLGARATRYLVDFYGDMSDGINIGQGSDRLLVEWQLDEPAVMAAAQRHPAIGELAAAVEGAQTLLDQDRRPRDPADTGARWLRCAVPADIDRLRRTDPEGALAWRHAVRHALGGAFDRGYHVTGFVRDGWYLLEPAANRVVSPSSKSS